ncbi:hypothetical protein CF335_g4975 [Tilletia laevis]|nr:hypothetical protein CF335_g4975 [Tilletia laevis]
MLAIIPPCERPSGAAFGHGTMINTAVSRLLLGNGGRGSPLPLNGGRRISTSSTMSTEQMLHHKVSVSSSMGHSDATLVEEYSKANTYHHATSFFPTMERGLEASRMRSLPALRLPQGPFPELPQPPPHRIRSSSFRRDVVRSSLDEDVDRSSGEFQQRARRLSQSVDEEDEEEDSRQAMDIDRDSPHGRSSTPVLGSSRPHKRHRSSSPPTEIMQLSMQKNYAAAPEARAERSESRFPSLSELGLIAQMRITPRQ